MSAVFSDMLANVLSLQTYQRPAEFSSFKLPMMRIALLCGLQVRRSDPRSMSKPARNGFSTSTSQAALRRLLRRSELQQPHARYRPQTTATRDAGADASPLPKSRHDFCCPAGFLKRVQVFITPSRKLIHMGRLSLRPQGTLLTRMQPVRTSLLKNHSGAMTRCQ